MGPQARKGHEERLGDHDPGYRIIDPEDYPRLGIDPADVLVGTVAAEDHPRYLLSRYGGNAFGLGLFEQLGRPGEDEADLLAGLDLDDPQVVRANIRRINEAYHRLGLFIRYTTQGRPFYLIPIAWLAHSTAEFQDRAEEIEKQVRIFQQTRLKERLQILIISREEEPLAADLMWRLGGFKVTLCERLTDLKDLGRRFDLIILPHDPVAFVTGQSAAPTWRARLRKKDVFFLCRYLSAKIYDLLESGGRLVLMAGRRVQDDGTSLNIHFKDNQRLINFLLFSHVFKTKRRYQAKNTLDWLEVDRFDLFNFLTQETISRRNLAALTKGRSPAELTPDEIDRLDYLDLKPRSHPFADQRQLWAKLFDPFFSQVSLSPLRLARTSALLAEGLETTGPLPGLERIYVGDRREPKISLKGLESEAARLGLPGCPLPLLAEYKDSFAYLLDVLEILNLIRADRLTGLRPLIRARIRMPFDRRLNKTCFFNDVPELIRIAPRLNRLRAGLNAFDLEGKRTPVLANLEKLSLLGVKPAQLREIFLILVGHSTMSRITLGKLRVSTLSALTQVLAGQDQTQVVNTVIAARLMSLAEMAALKPEGLPPAQADELFSISDQTIRVASDSDLDWPDVAEDYVGSIRGGANQAIRRLLKLFGLFEFLDDWESILKLGPHEKEALADYDPGQSDRIEDACALVERTRYMLRTHREGKTPQALGFVRRFLEREFHGTTRLLPSLGPVRGLTLIWTAVGVGPAAKINFNPLFPEGAASRSPGRLKELIRALSELETEDLSPARLDALAQGLSPTTPIFIYDSGLRFRHNTRLGTLDVSFVHVERDLKRLNELIANVEGRSIGDQSTADLRELSIRFGNLSDYLEFMSRPELREMQADRGERDLFPVRSKKIELTVERLREVFSGGLFNPDQIHDHLVRLHREAPRIFELLLPELAEMDRLPPVGVHYPGQTLLSFFKEVAFKFQALISGRLDAFQDERLLHFRALQEFGPRAGGGVGVSLRQMDILREMVHRLSQKRYHLIAGSVALTFQDLGRLPSYRRRFRTTIDLSSHGRAGAELLHRAGILDRYQLAPRARTIAVFLIAHHGLLGRLVKGEERTERLAVVTDEKNSDLFDNFFIHNLVALAAVNQEALTEDLMDWLLKLREEASLVIREELSWPQLIRLKRQGKLDLHRELNEERLDRPRRVGLPGGVRADMRPLDEEPATARALTGIERLYRLQGLWFVTFDAVLRFRRKEPLDRIHRLLGLASLGPASLERGLFEALRLEREGLAAIGPRATGYLLARLSDLDRPAVLLGFSQLAEGLSPVNRLKLAVIGLRAAEVLTTGDELRINFRYLSEIMADRYEFINEALADLDLELLLTDDEAIKNLRSRAVGIRVSLNSDRRIVIFLFMDEFQPQAFALEVKGITDPDHLAQAFHDRLLELRRSPYNIQAYELALENIFERRRAEMTSRAIQRMIRRINESEELEELFELRLAWDDDPLAFELNPGQQEAIDHAFEVRRANLRGAYARNWTERLERLRNLVEMDQLWFVAKSELKAKRRLIGRPLELRISRWFDAKARELGDYSALPAERPKE